MYLEYCHPVLNYDIALTMALIAIIGSKGAFQTVCVLISNHFN